MAITHISKKHAVVSSRHARFNAFGVVTPDGSASFVSPTGKAKAKIQFARIGKGHYAAEYCFRFQCGRFEASALPISAHSNPFQTEAAAKEDAARRLLAPFIVPPSPQAVRQFPCRAGCIGRGQGGSQVFLTVQRGTTITTQIEFFSANFDADEQYYARTYGCAKSAIPGLIYYSDTCTIYDQFKGEIWQFISEYGGPAALLDADDFRPHLFRKHHGLACLRDLCSKAGRVPLSTHQPLKGDAK